jgi:hypothetical protein
MTMLRRMLLNTIVLFIFIDGASFAAESGIEYRRIVRDEITVFCADEDLVFGQEILNLIHDELPRIAPQLGISAFPAVQVVIAASDPDFHRLTTAAIPDWGIGAADAGSGFIFLKSPRYAGSADQMYSVARHELVHVLVGSIASGHEVPRWLDEGLAQVLSEERSMHFFLRLARSVQARDLIRLDEIDEVLTFQKQRAALAYETSRSAVDFFIQTYGQQAIILLLRKLGQGLPPNEAMLASTYQTMGTFESAWINAIRSRYRWAFVINFPFLISASFALLFIAAYWMTRCRVAEKRRLWESEESDDDEEITTRD